MTGTFWRTELPTAWGRFTALFASRGLARLWFPGAAPARFGTAESSSPPADFPRADPARWKAQTEAALTRALRGAPPETLPPLDWPLGGTPFQVSVWRALLRIPPGRPTTYGALAARLGRPGAARAVGGACGANPVPVLIPCHRVLAAGGGLGGFSAGREWKRRLLAVEAATDWPDCP